MKCKKYFAVCLTAAAQLLLLTGCSHGQAPALANELTFSLDGIDELTISYDEETMTFYESEGNELTIREYMTSDNSRYYARTDQSGGSIRISEGGKPFFKSGFSRYVEVYLPASCCRTLTVTSTNGLVDLSGTDLSPDALRIDNTSGTIRLRSVNAQSIYLSTTSGTIEADSLTADTIRIDTTQGRFSCGALRGNAACTTTGGELDISSAAGQGSYQVLNSGRLHVAYAEVTGDLSFFNKNDDIHVALPADLEFEFEAKTKNGEISTTFQEWLSEKDGTVSGSVGGHPSVTVKAETKNGNIEVTR